METRCSRAGARARALRISSSRPAASSSRRSTSIARGFVLILGKEAHGFAGPPQGLSTRLAGRDGPADRARSRRVPHGDGRRASSGASASTPRRRAVAAGRLHRLAREERAGRSDKALTQALAHVLCRPFHPECHAFEAQKRGAASAANRPIRWRWRRWRVCSNARCIRTRWRRHCASAARTEHQAELWLALHRGRGAPATRADRRAGD